LAELQRRMVEMQIALAGGPCSQARAWHDRGVRAPLHPDAESDRARNQGDDPRTIPFLKRFTVFSTDQCDQLPDEVATMAPPPPEGMILPEVEALIRATDADLRIGSERASIRPRVCRNSFVQV
jgi:antirestriction protein ArdC